MVLLITLLREVDPGPRYWAQGDLDGIRTGKT